MKDIIIVGAGGFAREVVSLIEEINEENKEWNLCGYVDDNKEIIGEDLNGYKVIGNLEYLNQISNDIYIVVAIGNSNIRKAIVERIRNKKYATLIHPQINISKFNKIGEGTIICKNSLLTVNISIGRHIIINLDCTIGHDAVLEDYVTVFPSVNISGKTIIRERTELGTNSCIIQGIEIGKNVTVGAGSVVIKEIGCNCVVVGNPAKKIKDKG